MCGITGVFRAAGLAPQDRSALGRMMALLHHRGPDGNGQHVAGQAGVAMGHTRLSIIDLSTKGNQPLRDPQHQVVLTVNGEFYDYKTLRAKFATQGERFLTKTDSELAIKLYAQYGLDFVQHLRGEFAIALYDEQQERLVLVRDRFGVRPLFYRVQDETLIYGSEMKALLAHPDVPAELSERAMLHQMMQVMPPGMTAFKGIRALLPGHMLVVSRRAGRLEVSDRCYWDMDYPQAGDHDPNPDPAPYIQGVTDQLLDAVRVRLEADVPVGCYLSGGIDSCSILGLATAMQQSPVKAFTISFDHDAYDEAAIATEMAMSTGAEQEIMRLAADELYGESFVRTLFYAERTFYNTLGVAKWHMSKRVRECGIKVVVTGEGSDEIFGGYPFFKRDYLLHAPEMASEGAALRAQMDESNAVFKGAILSEEEVTHPAFQDLLGFTPSWIQPWMLTLKQARPLFSDMLLDQLRSYDPIAALAESLNPAMLKGRHVLDQVQYTWIKTQLEGQILNWGGDRVDMGNSMESRPPFLDHHLAEYARTIPPVLRIRGGVEKWVLREAMKGVLPEVLYKREKFAFMAPPGHTDRRKRSAMQALCSRHMGEEQIRETGLFDVNRVQAFLEGYFTGTDPVQGARSDILFNHLVGIHLLKEQVVP